MATAGRHRQGRWRTSATSLLALIAIGAVLGPAEAQTVAPETILTPADSIARARTRPRPPADPGLRRGQDLDEEGNLQRPEPAATDGDLTSEREPEPLKDGIITESEPVSTLDAPEGLGRDARSGEDVSAFATPPAGADPLLFRIDDIDPLADRRIERLFRLEPYDPIGYRIGSFVVFPQLELAGVAFSNVLSSPRARADRALAMTPEIRAVTAWSWHGFEVRARGNYSFHDEFASEDDRAGLIEARGRIDITSRTNLQAQASREITQESRTGVDAATSQTRADITTTAFAASFNHRFNRLSVQLRGGVSEVDFAGVRQASVLDSNVDRNFTTAEQAARVSYELKPTLTAFAEVAANQRDYQAPASDGIVRDSTGTRVRAGLGFGSTSQVLRGEASFGWGHQTPDDSRLARIDGYLLDANLVWRMTPLTSLLFNARTEFGDSTDPGITGALGRTLGLEARHAFRTWLIGSAGLQQTHYSYTGSALAETTRQAQLGIEYYLAREIVLFGRYQHQWLDSNASGADWQSDEARVGVRIRK